MPGKLTAARQAKLRVVAQQDRFQRDFDHVVERSLTLIGGGLLVGADMVGNGADSQRFRTELCRNAIDTRRFHLDAENAVLLHHVEHLAIRGVEEIGREEVTHARVDAKVFAASTALRTMSKSAIAAKS